jgi:hypothetical protein
MKAFVLTDKDGQIKDRDMLDLYDGYLALNFPVQFFTETELYLNRNLITKDDIFGGHVNICKQIWKNIGVDEPYLDCYPSLLEKYLGRCVRKMTVKRFYNLLDENGEFGETYFVKPLKNKLFTGFTCTTRIEAAIKIPCSNKTDVYVSSYVNFGAEFRAYVFNNKIVDVFRYWGDNWEAVVDKPTVDNMVCTLTGTMPSFYSLDFGVDDKGNTLLVEVNDGYALGNYGLGPKQYAEMTAVRCREIVTDFIKTNTQNVINM